MAFYGKVEALRGAKPWFVMSAITQLEDELVKPDWVAFEWGSGGSTLWLSQWCAHVVSIEHDPDWFVQNRAELQKYGIDNVELIHVSKQAGASEYDEYSKYVQHWPELAFNLVFVDGRNRAACLGYAVSRLRSGGVLVLDNSERAQYQAAIAAHLTGWQRWDHLSQGGGYAGWTTTVWIKP